MSEVTIRVSELPVLLNILPSKITVDYPLTNEQIVTAEAEGKHYELEAYIDQAHSYSDSEIWDLEKPGYGDYRQCFLASGLIAYENIREWRMDYQKYSNLRVKTVYAPDTNLFYHQFLSTGYVKPEEVLLVDSVQKEITNVLNKKYTSAQISELKHTVRYQRPILDEFINGRRKQSRLAAYLALSEYRRHSNRVYAVIQTQNLRDDKEENDKLFVESVKRYQSTSSTLSVVLTSDRILADIYESVGVSYFILELPSSINPQYASPEQLCSLISNLSGVFGVIQVNKALVFREFRGKTDYDDLKVKFLGGEVPLELERDLEICRELVKLKIDF